VAVTVIVLVVIAVVAVFEVMGMRGGGRQSGSGLRFRHLLGF